MHFFFIGVKCNSNKSKSIQLLNVSGSNLDTGQFQTHLQLKSII